MPWLCRHAGPIAVLCLALGTGLGVRGEGGLAARGLGVPVPLVPVTPSGHWLCVFRGRSVVRREGGCDSRCGFSSGWFWAVLEAGVGTAE